MLPALVHHIAKEHRRSPLATTCTVFLCGGERKIGDLYLQEMHSLRCGHEWTPTVFFRCLLDVDGGMGRILPVFSRNKISAVHGQPLTELLKYPDFDADKGFL